MRNGSTKTAPTLLLALATAMASASPAASQTRLFEPWNEEVDVSTYTTIEECTAASRRVLETWEIRESRTTHVVPDTMPFVPVEARRPMPPVVVETVRTCLNAASEHVDTVAVNAWKLLAPMYLIADMDDRARAVVKRRLAAVEPDSTDELSRVLIDAVGKVYFDARPPRHELAEEVGLEYVDQLPKLMDRLWVYQALLHFPVVQTGGDLNEDSEAGARGRRLMARLKNVLNAMPRSELQRMIDEEFPDVTATPEDVSPLIGGAFMLNAGRAFVRDSLRVSTETYVRTVRELGLEDLVMLLLGPVGERPPRLEGDIWLGCEQDPCEPYPRPGRVTLVWFGPESRCLDYKLLVENMDTHWCGSRIPLRRLQDRFPEIDVVIATQSMGRYAYVKDGMTPEREAQLIRKWLDTFGLDRAVLSMTETQGWRLPEPDGRWAVRHETANQKNYFPNPRSAKPVLLIDQDGYVVHGGMLWGGTDTGKILGEEEFVKLIEILLEREKAGMW